MAFSFSTAAKSAALAAVIVSQAHAQIFSRDEEELFSGLPTFGVIEGAAFFDFDNDGELDLFLCNSDSLLPADMPTILGYSYLLRRGNGTYTDVTAETGLSGAICNGVFAADFDNDGDQDLILTRNWQGNGCVVFQNNGDSTFSVLDSTALECPPFVQGLAVGDVDNDGYLDVYAPVVNQFAPSENIPSSMFLGNGDLTFTVIPFSGAENVRFPCDASFMDMDNDGDADLIVLGCNELEAPFNLVPAPMYWFRNLLVETGQLLFLNDPNGFGIPFFDPDLGPASIQGIWMSTAFGDVDGDGKIDLYVGNAGCGLDNSTCADPHALFVNQAGGLYTEQGDTWDVAEGLFNWGSTFIDLENDGDHDLVTVGAAPFPLVNTQNPGSVFENNGNSLELVEELGLTAGTGLARGDYDNDGLEDLVLQTFFLFDQEGALNTDGLSVLLHNDSPNINNYIKIRLVGVTSNRDAIGAKVVLRYADVVQQQRGEIQVQSKAVVVGSSTASTDDKVLTFGMGRRGRVIAITVRWPNGERQIVRRPGVVNTLITITEGVV